MVAGLRCGAFPPPAQLPTCLELVAMALSRRQFLERAAALAAVPSLAACPRLAPAAESTSPNEKLDLAIIGVAGQGEYNTDNVASENIVALCDVDAQRLAKAAE